MWHDKELIGFGLCKKGLEPKRRKPTEYKEGDRNKILCEETRGKSQELAVGKLTPLHTIIFPPLQVSKYGKSNQQHFSLT